MTEISTWLSCQAFNGDKSTLLGLRTLALHLHRATPGGIVNRKEPRFTGWYGERAPDELHVLACICGHPRSTHHDGGSGVRYRVKAWATWVRQLKKAQTSVDQLTDPIKELSDAGETTWRSLKILNSSWSG